MDLNKIKLGRNLAVLVSSLLFLFVFSCIVVNPKGEDNNNSGGDNGGDTTKFTLTITKPENGTLSSEPEGIDCGSEGAVCEAEFDKDTEVTLTATAGTGYASGDWGDACEEASAGKPCKLSMDTDKTVSKIFSLLDSDGDGEPDATDIDDDNDGLIEVHNLDMFDHIQHNLDGTSYKNSDSAADDRTGAPEAETDDCDMPTDSFYLCGYELAKNLDFAEGASYASGSVNADWRPNDQADASGSAATPDSAVNAGFVGATGFAGIFEGNGHSISNLYSRETDATLATNMGLFRTTVADAVIRNLGVVDASLYGNADEDKIGALVGENQGNIIASYATGGTLNGGAGVDHVGGLVGNNENGNIIASYATGTANGNDRPDHVGGLVGNNENGNIIASYATGAANGGGGADSVGGLVGNNDRGQVTASYATGDVDGGTGGDNAGVLVGDSSRRRDQIASYGFGNVTVATSTFGAPPAGVTSANDLTAMNAGTEWNDASQNTLGAWDFGDNMQAPALKYADYDDAGDTYNCNMFPDCNTLLPGQGR